MGPRSRPLPFFLARSFDPEHSTHAPPGQDVRSREPSITILEHTSGSSRDHLFDFHPTETGLGVCLEPVRADNTVVRSQLCILKKREDTIESNALNSPDETTPPWKPETQSPIFCGVQSEQTQQTRRGRDLHQQTLR